MATVIDIDLRQIEPHDLQPAVDALRTGGVIIYPTDTIYGLGCDITNSQAVQRVQQIKGRDANKPMSFVCADLRDISRYARVSEYARGLLERDMGRKAGRGECRTYAWSGELDPVG